jgi:hypothetical protein
LYPTLPHFRRGKPMQQKTEYRLQNNQNGHTDEGLEFAPIPWAEQMRALVSAFRVRGHAIPENATVSLVPVPAHLRGDNGLPLYRVAIVAPDDSEGDQ